MRKKLTLKIKLALIAMVMLSVSAGDVYADDITYQTSNRLIQSKMSVQDINGMWYMVGDLEKAGYYGESYPDDSDNVLSALDRILTLYERIDIGLSMRYLCIDGILYDLEMMLNGSEAGGTANRVPFEEADTGTLQGFLNTGTYTSWDTEPVAGSTDNPMVEEPKEPEITVTDMSAVMYATKDCNVRDGGSTSYKKIGSLKFNEEVTVTGICSTGWYRIEYNGGVGYVSGTLLTDTKYEEPIDLTIIYNDLDETALDVLNKLIESDDYEAAVLVYETAEHKVLPKETMTLIRAANKEVRVSFVDEAGLARVVYTLNNVSDETALDLAYTLENNVYTFGTTDEPILYPYTLSVLVKTELTDEVYAHVGNETDGYTMFETYTVTDGYIPFTTNLTGAYTFSKEDLSYVPEPEPPVVEEPEEPIVEEPSKPEETPETEEPVITEPTEPLDTQNNTPSESDEETPSNEGEISEEKEGDFGDGAFKIIVVVCMGAVIICVVCVIRYIRKKK